MKTFDDWKEEWHAKAAAKGHELKLDEDGRIDDWQVDAGFHNGPACVKCHRSWCMHCTNADELEACGS